MDANVADMLILPLSLHAPNEAGAGGADRPHRCIFPGYDRPAGERLRRGGKGVKRDESADTKEALERAHQEVDDEQAGDDPHERVDLVGLALDELDDRVGHEAHADAD